MAQFRRPPDPRKPEYQGEVNGSRSRRIADDRKPVPWKWLGMGILITIVGITLTVALVAAFLRRDPLPLHIPTPTIIRLTAPATLFPSATGQAPTATVIPTFSPPPTPDLSIAPNSITVGYYAQVTNTDDVGVSLRGGPSTDNIRLQLLPEGLALRVVGGPEDAGDFIWWQVQLVSGEEGWIAGDFLAPSAAPDSSDDS